MKISLMRFIRMANPYIYYKSFYDLHEFYHVYSKQLSCVSCCKKIHDTPFHQFTAYLLIQIKKTIDRLTGADVSVHIKLFESENTDSVKINKAILRAYERINSSYENQQISSQKINQRKNDENYKITKGAHGSADHLITSNNDKINGKKILSNSAYNFCFNPKHHYWISNDLKKSVDKRYYYSESDNYKNYYNSLAVFLISPHIESGTDVYKINQNVPMGLLIIDSHKTGRFDYKIFPQLCGLFAHLLYDFFIRAEQLMADPKPPKYNSLKG